jgi:ribosomal protein RSM22 (predicted rRNA methylase)
LITTGCAERVTIDAVDIDPFALSHGQRLVQRVARSLGLAIELRPQTLSAELEPTAALARALPDAARYDLVLCGLVLNELTHAGSEPDRTLIDSLCGRLADDGALIALEPALRSESRKLQALRDVLVASQRAPFVFAPCLHERACPLLARERDWCHVRIEARLPERIAKLALAAGLRAEDLTFSYLTLRKQRGSFADSVLRSLEPSAPRIYRVVSSPLESKGKLELLVCGNTEEQRLRRLDRHASAEHAPLESAQRGEVLSVSGPEAKSPTRDVLRVGADARILHVLEIGCR